MDHDGHARLSRRIELRNRNDECNRLFEFLDENLEQLPVSREFRHDLKLACEELLANIINHGYDESTENTVGLELAVEDDAVRITFTDAGKAFNPLATETPDSLNDLSEGGVGILLAKSLTDEQHYQRQEGLNVLTVTKNYN